MQRLAVAVLACVAVPARAQNANHLVILTYRVTNPGEAPAEGVIAHCLLPGNNGYQELIDLKIQPKPEKMTPDRVGQHVATVELGDIPPGESRFVRILARGRLKSVSVPLVGSDKVEPLADDERKANLADGPLLSLEKVRPTAEQAAAGKRRDVDKARAVYEWMSENCGYDIDEHADPATKVISGTPASCTELAYTCIALCRALGVPARTVSAVVNRQGLLPSADYRGHRWAEFYAEGIGWVPVDPTNRINYTNQNFFARQQGRYLVFIDDGLPLEGAIDPGWRMLWVMSKTPQARLDLGRGASWIVSRDRVLEDAFFEEACAARHEPDAARRLEALQGWEKARKPMRMAFFLEALYDSDEEVVKFAAGAIARMKDPTVMVALMDRAQGEAQYPIVAALMASAAELLKVGNAEIRAEAVEELAKSRSEEALRLLKDVWKDKDREVRKAAAKMMYKFGDRPEVHEAYRTLVEDQDEFVSVLATLRWARVGSTEVMPRLVKLLDSKVRWDRQQALAALMERTQDGFGFVAADKPDTPRNREAIIRFKDWLVAHPEAK